MEQFERRKSAVTKMRNSATQLKLRIEISVDRDQER